MSHDRFDVAACPTTRMQSEISEMKGCPHNISLLEAMSVYAELSNKITRQHTPESDCKALRRGSRRVWSQAEQAIKCLRLATIVIGICACFPTAALAQYGTISD